MIIYLACVASVLSVLTPTTYGISTYGPSTTITEQQCTVHNSVKEAAVNAYLRNVLDQSLTIHAVDTTTMTVKALPRPTVRLEVDEGK